MDYVLTTSSGALNYSRDLHDKNMSTFNSGACCCAGGTSGCCLACAHALSIRPPPRNVLNARRCRCLVTPAAKEQYYGIVESTVDRVKAMIDPTPYVAWAAEQVQYYADPDKIVDTGVEVAGKVASFGPGATRSSDPAGGGSGGNARADAPQRALRPSFAHMLHTYAARSPQGR